MDDLIVIGKIGKPHGIKGAVSVHLTADIQWNDTEYLFIEIQNEPVPFFIETLDVLSKKIVVKLKGISSWEDAKKLTHLNIWLPKKIIIKNEWEQWIGFKVLDTTKNNQWIGTVENFLQNNGLIWMEIQRPNCHETFLLPYHSHFIERISESEKIIYYKSVEGMY